MIMRIMMRFVPVLLAVLISVVSFFWHRILCQKSRKIVQESRKQFDFSANASDGIIAEYTSRMPDQQKMNSTILDGTGKMHYVDVVAEGSKLVLMKKISVVENLGVKFS